MATLIHRIYILGLVVAFHSSFAASTHQHAGPPPLKSGVAGFDVYREGRALHLLTAEFDDARQERALFYRQSSDGGKRWTAPTRIDAGDAAVYDIVRGNDPQIAAYGEKVVAAWTIKGTGYAASGPIVTAVSNDGGKTWRAGSNPADDHSTQGHAYIDLAAGHEGFDIVWLDGRDGAQGLRYARSADGFAWSRNVTVQKTTCECCWNSLTRRGEALFVMLRGKEPRDMLLAEREVSGAWQQRGTVGAFKWDFKGCPHTGGGLAWTGTEKQSDALHAIVWTGAESREGLHYLKSVNRGRTWSSPHHVGSIDARRADIAADEGGRVLLVWDQLEGERRAIYAMQSRDAGQRWLRPMVLSSANADAIYPRATATATGFTVMWTENAPNAAAVLRTKRIE